MTTQGVDFASGSTNFGATLHAAGKFFAMRYLASDWRGITPAEYDDLRANGIDVGFISEGSGSDALGGFSAGVAAAQRAQAIINANHWPDQPIYFAIDFNADSTQYAVVDQFLNGAASVIGHARTGVYASYYVIVHCQGSGSAARFWQTYAWSNGNVASNIDLLQYLNGQSIAGHTVDLCESWNTAFTSVGGVTVITESEDEMPQNWNVGGTIATIGGTWAQIWTDPTAFDYLSNIAAWGTPVVKNMTMDELKTIVAECNARGAAYSKVTVDVPEPPEPVIDVNALATSIAQQIVIPTQTPIDVPTLAKEIAAALPQGTQLTQSDIVTAVKTVFAQAGA